MTSDTTRGVLDAHGVAFMLLADPEWLTPTPLATTSWRHLKQPLLVYRDIAKGKNIGGPKQPRNPLSRGEKH